jgi:segregation and condensation protein B
METLAIIAYNQPVTRSYIDAVRGVDSAYAVNSLLDRHLIEPCGRLDAPGRPMLYATTPDFLRVFGLTSLADLPDGDALALASATKFDEVQREAGEAEAEAETEAAPEAEAEIPAETTPEPAEETPVADEEPDSLPDPEEELPEGAIDFTAVTDG